MNIEEYEKIRVLRRKSSEKMEKFEVLNREKDKINKVIKALENDLKIETIELFVRNSNNLDSLFIERTKIDNEIIIKLKDFLIALKNKAEKQIEEI